MTALRRHRFFGFGSKPLIEVSSPAVAERLAAVLNPDAAPALHADYAVRAKMDFVRSEIRRRDWCYARSTRARAAYRRALHAAATATTPHARHCALARAHQQRRKAMSFASTAVSAAENARRSLALLDPNSPESAADRSAKADFQVRVAALRAAREASGSAA